MRRLALCFLVMTSAACGDDDGNIVGTVGWRLNFKDWTCNPNDTAMACQDQIRTCSNAPTSGTPIVPYNAIDKVRVVVEDAAGQVPGIDQMFGCAAGSDGLRAEIIGIVKQSYRLTIQAMTSGGVVFYEHKQDEFDLTTRQDTTFDLLPAVGELEFFAVFPAPLAVGECPAGPDTMHYRLFQKDNGMTPPAPTKSGVMPACTGGSMTQTVLREVPVAPVQGTGGGFLPQIYRMELEVQNSSGAITHCAVNDSRAVRPANNSSINNENLVATTTCP